MRKFLDTPKWESAQIWGCGVTKLDMICHDFALTWHDMRHHFALTWHDMRHNFALTWHDMTSHDITWHFMTWLCFHLTWLYSALTQLHFHLAILSSALTQLDFTWLCFNLTWLPLDLTLLGLESTWLDMTWHLSPSSTPVPPSLLPSHKFSSNSSHSWQSSSFLYRTVVKMIARVLPLMSGFHLLDCTQVRTYDIIIVLI